MKKFEVRHNVPLMYVLGSLMWGRFFIPVLALFYIASQVPIEQFAIIMSVFALSTLLLEIPSGVIADLLGKKKTLLIGRFCYIIEIFMIAFYDGFWIFLVAKVVSGIGVSLNSGTNSALLFDTLKKMRKPILWLRGGKSKRGQSAVLTHTGSLGTDDNKILLYRPRIRAGLRIEHIY